MKLWHDDIRPAPEGWTWARTNERAQELLRTGKVTEASLDHDLGLHDVDMTPPECGGDADEWFDKMLLRGGSEETGYDLCVWMVEEGFVPKKITIHSWNPAGAQRMAAALFATDAEIIVHPFTVVRS